MERTTVRLPTALLQRARRKAAAEGRTLTSLIEEGLRNVVAKPASASDRRRNVKLPVSSATGGAHSGLLLDHLARDVQEGDDAAYVRRLWDGFS